MKIKIVKESTDPFDAAMRHMGSDPGITDPDAGTVPMPSQQQRQQPSWAAGYKHKLNQRTDGQIAKEKAEELGYEIVKPLGQGFFGKVYLVTKDGKEYAFKMVKKQANREVNNYKTVSDARNQSPIVAKHFPEVFYAEADSDDRGYIIMELLTDKGPKSLIIPELVGDGEMIVPINRDNPYKNLKNRMYMYLRNENIREGVLFGMFSLFMAPPDVKTPIEEALKYRFGDDFGVEYLKTKSIAGNQKLIDSLEQRARSVISSDEEEFIFDRSGALKDEFVINPGALTFLVIALETVRDADPFKGTPQSWFTRTQTAAVVEFMTFYRQGAPVPFDYGDMGSKGGAPEQIASVYKDAMSIREAMKELANITGLFAKDVHGGNIMIRPSTQDFVVVDLGLFKPRPKQGYYEGKRWSKKQRKKRKKGCANPKGFTMKQFCKNQKTKSKKGERKNEGMNRNTISIKIRRDLEERCQKGYKTHPTRKTKKMFGRTYRNCVKAEGQVEEKKLTDAEKNKREEIAQAMERDNPGMDKSKKMAIATDVAKRVAEGDPKKGTGKKPKGSGRRLYTDEDPSDTVSVSFKSVSAIKKTLAKPSFKSKSHKRQSQIINLIHQRSRAAYQNAKDPKVKARLKKAFDYAKKRKEASKKKTIRMRKKKK